MAVALGLVALLLVGVGRVRVETGVDDFVPRGDRTLAATGEAAEEFGGDPVVVLLESTTPGALLDKERMPDLLRLEGELAQLPDVARVYGPGTVLNQIAGQAQDLLAELSGYRDALRSRAEREARERGASAAEAEAAARAATSDFDERYTALLAQGMPGGLPTLHNQAFIDRVVFNAEGDPRPQWDFLVPRPDAVVVLVRPRSSLSQSATERLVGAVQAAVDASGVGRGDAIRKATVSGVPAVVASLGEQIRHEIPLLGGVAVLTVGAWFLLTGWTRRRVRLLPLGATLLGTAAVLALAGWAGRPLPLTAVAFLPVLLGIGSDFMTYLHRGAGGRTVVAAALASAAGFAALLVAPVPAVAELGASLAVGLVVTVLVSLGLQRLFPGLRDDTAPPARVVQEPRGAAGARGPLTAAVVAVVAAATAGWVLFPTLDLRSDFNSLADGLQRYDDAQHVQRVVGTSGEVLLVVRGADVLDAASLAWMDGARQQLVTDHGDALSPVLSPPDLLAFLGATPGDDQVAAAVRLLPPYLASSVVTPERDLAIMSYGVDLDDVARLSTLRTYLRDLAATAPPGLDVEVAGLPMVAVSAHDAMRQDRMLAAVLGVVAAGLVLLLVLRERRVALVAVLSAATASGLVALGLVVAGATLSPMTAGLGSLTAAVACEFTVLLAHARRTGDARLARAVDLAAAASGTGYVVLALSQLGVIRDFGILLALTVAVSLAVSRLLVRALLPGAGRVAVVATAQQERVLEVVG
ncbi:MMPL family transporter [Nocardioides carbamazepini]|uniref:MMPL family transporter n=1 Tax=Nocardioides carbamazepini TaxID=2854259 RepID=UPI002149AA1A|nr:MMPL family transporter [Nocardioides carbamazepini]MCR1785753.1 MMPL family transporter [Nocardioides carbamazepini]